MNELQLVKSDKFGEVEYNIYSDSKEMFMTSEQLGECLQFSNGRKGIDNIVSRNEYLNSPEFSVTLKLRATDGKCYNTRVFTEDGIYEVTMLARTGVAKEFRARVRKVLKALRSGEISAKPNKALEIKEINARVRLSNQFLKIAKIETLSAESRNILAAKAAEVLAGTELIPQPDFDQKTYSAAEVGKMLGVTAQKIGRISNEHNMKISEYGAWYRSKSEYSDREVDTFRYNDKAIERFREILVLRQIC